MEPPEYAESAAALAREKRVGEADAYDSIADLVSAPDIYAIWICGPTHKRMENLKTIVGNEASVYGYAGENRHFVQCFLDGEQPELDFHSDRGVTELLMSAYMSAEKARTLEWKPDGLHEFDPAVQKETWSP